MQNRFNRKNFLSFIAITIISLTLVVSWEQGVIPGINLTSDLFKLVSINAIVNESCNYFTLKNIQFYNVEGTYIFLLPQDIVTLNVDDINLSIAPWIFFLLVFSISPYSRLTTRILMVSITIISLFYTEAFILSKEIESGSISNQLIGLETHFIDFLVLFTILFILNVIVEGTIGYVSKVYHTRSNWDLLTWIDHVEYWMKQKV